MLDLIRNPKFLPTVLVVLDIGSAICYGAAGDFRHVIYWIAAGVLTASVTY